MTKEELRNEYNKKLHDMDKYEGYYDYQAVNYVEWLEDNLIRAINNLNRKPDIIEQLIKNGPIFKGVCFEK